MDDVFRGEIEPLCDNRFACLYRGKIVAGVLKSVRARRAEYEAADAIAHLELRVGGIDDGVNVEFRYVVPDYGKRHASPQFSFTSDLRDYFHSKR